MSQISSIQKDGAANAICLHVPLVCAHMHVRFTFGAPPPIPLTQTIYSMASVYLIRHQSLLEAK